MNRILASFPSANAEARRAKIDIYGSVLTAHPDSRKGRPATNRGLAAHRKRSGLPNLESQEAPDPGPRARRYDPGRTKLPRRLHTHIFMSLQRGKTPRSTRRLAARRVRGIE